MLAESVRGFRCAIYSHVALLLRDPELETLAQHGGYPGAHPAAGGAGGARSLQPGQPLT